MASKKRLTVVDLFAGCGGLSLGLEQAGFEALAFSEINKDASDTYLLNRPLNPPKAYGDVYELLRNNGAELDRLREQWADQGIDRVDLVAGGPPCQGYSGIGHRRSYKVEKKEVPSNHLYRAMIEVIRHLEPRMFLFENVKGIMTGRWTADGKPGEIFRDVLAAFKAIDIDGRRYLVKHALVHAKDYGVPQNRPRVLIVGFHEDLNWRPKATSDDAVESGMLPRGQGEYPNLEDVFEDLIDDDYLASGETKEYPREPSPANTFAREMRQVPPFMRKSFQLTEHVYSRHSEKIRTKFAEMIKEKGVIPENYRTKKFAQRLLLPRWTSKGPTITATSLPDDFVHWEQPRILTVREWARLQTFPDWYRFAGPRTTGGLRRAGNPTAGVWDREVPKYTQIGNAVPVRLAKAVGVHLGKILKMNRARVLSAAG